MKKISAFIFILAAFALLAVVCNAQEPLEVRITNGAYDEQLTLTDRVEVMSFEIDYSSGITVELIDGNKEASFAYIVDNSAFDYPDVMLNSFTVTPSEASSGERIVIRTEDGEYDIVYKTEPVELSGGMYVTEVYGLDTAFADRNEVVSALWQYDENVSIQDFVSEYVGEKDGYERFGIYLTDAAGNVEEQQETLYPLKISRKRYFWVAIDLDWRLGNDIRVYKISGAAPELMYAYNGFSDGAFDIETTKLGEFVMVYDEHDFSAEFYTDPDTLYARIDGITNTETSLDIDIPKRDGYVFKNWVKNGVSMREDSYIWGRWYALWVPEDEYEPLKLTLTSNERIEPGHEDGKTVTLTASKGYFSYYFYLKNDISIEGGDEIGISEVVRVDDRSIRLTLSGNSTGENGNGRIVFSGGRLSCDTPQLNESGRIKSFFISDNGIYDAELTNNEVEITRLWLTDAEGEQIQSMSNIGWDSEVYINAEISGSYDGDAVLIVEVTGVRNGARPIKRIKSTEVKLDDENRAYVTVKRSALREYVGSVRAFLWESKETMKPLCEAKTISTRIQWAVP